MHLSSSLLWLSPTIQARLLTNHIISNKTWDKCGRLTSELLKDAYDYSYRALETLYKDQQLPAPASEQPPSHSTHIDNDRSVVIEKLSNLTKGRFDDSDMTRAKVERAQAYARKGYCITSHCSHDTHPLSSGSQTLFVNASIEGRDDDLPVQPPWIVDIELPNAAGTSHNT
ncbi:hypothetical protein PG994_010021 [Apiospora phragmitis]|uniref:Uncharacterized protein n=1 Tax=Apiospora phragmitis TaxID=2905665 RepID=A0ABR1TQZ0_9PEZI